MEGSSLLGICAGLPVAMADAERTFGVHGLTLRWLYLCRARNPALLVLSGNASSMLDGQHEISTARSMYQSSIITRCCGIVPSSRTKLAILSPSASAALTLEVTRWTSSRSSSTLSPCKRLTLPKLSVSNSAMASG